MKRFAIMAVTIFSAIALSLLGATAAQAGENVKVDETAGPVSVEGDAQTNANPNEPHGHESVSFSAEDDGINPAGDDSADAAVEADTGH